MSDFCRHRRRLNICWPLFLFFVVLAIRPAVVRGQDVPPDQADTGRDTSFSGGDTLIMEIQGGDSAAPAAWDLPEDDTTTTAIRYQAERIDYQMENNLILLLGKAQVRYKEIKVLGDTIKFDTKEQVLTVNSRPVLYDRNEAIKGDRMIYDFKAKLGWIYNGNTDYNKGRYWGKKVRQVDDRTLNIDNGRYTTCDAEHPHYYFWSRQMKIYVNDKIVAQPVILCFGGIPTLAIPFWFFPMRKDRHSGFLMPKFGSNSYEGAFVKNLAYYQVLGERADATASADFLENTGWRGNFEVRYLAPPLLSSQLNFSYQDDKLTQHKRWSLKGDYSQRLGKRTSITGNGNFISDQNYYTDFSDSRTVRMDRNLHSYLALNHARNIASFYGALDHYNNLDARSTTSRLPDLTLNLYRKDIIKGMLGFSGSSHFLASDKRDTLSADRHQGWENRLDLSASFNALRWINLNPSLRLSGTWYDRDTAQARNALRWLYSGSLGASTTLYGLLELGTGPLKALRHVVKPNVTFSYIPKIDQGRFYTFMGGGQGESRSMSLGLNQQFQAKFDWRGKEKKIDLLSMSSSTGYNFLATGEKWSVLYNGMQLLPGSSPVDCQFSWDYNFYNRRSQNSRLDLSYGLSGKWLGWLEPRDSVSPEKSQSDSLKAAAEVPGDSLGDAEASAMLLPDSTRPGPADSVASGVSDSVEVVSRDSLASADSSQTGLEEKKPAKGLNWSFSLGYSQSWQAGQGVAGSDIRGSANFNLTKNWNVSYSRYYNLKTREMISQDYSIYRDLHCWEARFTSSKSQSSWSYMFIIRLKAIPEVKLESKSGRVVGYQ
jgi:hypothetical protein